MNRLCRRRGDRLTLAFECIQPEDVPELTGVMVRAFDHDAQRTFGVERGGPDGYDNGEFFRKWLFGSENSHGYKILARDRIIGAFIVWIYEDGRNLLGTIFVDPDYQNMGVGTEAWRFIEQTFPDTKSWELSTPSAATKNNGRFSPFFCWPRSRRASRSFSPCAPTFTGTSWPARSKRPWAQGRLSWRR